MAIITFNTLVLDTKKCRSHERYSADFGGFEFSTGYSGWHRSPYFYEGDFPFSCNLEASNHMGLHKDCDDWNAAVPSSVRISESVKLFLFHKTVVKRFSSSQPVFAFRAQAAHLDLLVDPSLFVLEPSFLFDVFATTVLWKAASLDSYEHSTHTSLMTTYDSSYPYSSASWPCAVEGCTHAGHYKLPSSYEEHEAELYVQSVLCPKHFLSAVLHIQGISAEGVFHFYKDYFGLRNRDLSEFESFLGKCLQVFGLLPESSSLKNSGYRPDHFAARPLLTEGGQIRLFDSEGNPLPLNEAGGYDPGVRGYAKPETTEQQMERIHTAVLEDVVGQDFYSYHFFVTGNSPFFMSPELKAREAELAKVRS